MVILGLVILWLALSIFTAVSFIFLGETGSFEVTYKQVYLYSFFAWGFCIIFGIFIFVAERFILMGL